MKTIYLKGEVGWEITAKTVLNQINIDSSEKLRVIVNSPGGSVWEAFEIYNIFKSYRGKIEFVLMPMAASAMSYIIMAGDEITAFKNSIFMAHQVMWAVIGNYEDMIIAGEVMKGLENIVAEAYQTRIKKKNLKSWP